MTVRPPGPWNRLGYAAIQQTLGRLVRAYFRVRVERRPRLDGAYVLAGNHVSFMDPLLVAAVSRRRVFFVMTSLHYRSPQLGWFYRFARAIPLSPRGANREGLQAARAVLRRGDVLGIFPEGGISRDGRLQLGNPGAVSLVLAEGAPIVPFALLGAERALPLGGGLPRPRRVTVRFGRRIPPEEIAALAPDRKRRLRLATRLIMDEIAALAGQTSREAELEAICAGKT